MHQDLKEDNSPEHKLNQSWNQGKNQNKGSFQWRKFENGRSYFSSLSWPTSHIWAVPPSVRTDSILAVRVCVCLQFVYFAFKCRCATRQTFTTSWFCPLETWLSFFEWVTAAHWDRHWKNSVSPSNLLLTLNVKNHSEVTYRGHYPCKCAKPLCHWDCGVLG